MVVEREVIAASVVEDRVSSGEGNREREEG